MEHFLALLSEARREKVTTTVKKLEQAKAVSSIRNKDFQYAKYVLGNAVSDARRAFFDKFDRHELTDGAQREFYYWYAQLHTAPSQVRKLSELKNDADKAFAELVLPWLREIAEIAELVGSVKPFILKGRQLKENPVPRDLTNTGTCAICNHNHKLNHGKLVLHGYQRPGDGFVRGRCFGVAYAPYEISCEANQDFAKLVAQEIAAAEEYIGRLERDEVGQLSRRERKIENGVVVKQTVVYVKGTPEFPGLRRDKLNSEQYRLKGLRQEQTVNQAKIDNWKVRPLPGGAK